MRSVIVPVAFMCFVVLTLSSCRITNFQTGNDGHLMYAKNLPDYEVVKQIQIHVKEQKAIFGLLNFSNPAKELGVYLEQERVNAEGDAILFLNMEYQNDLIGIIFNVLRVGFLYKSRNIIVNAQVIKYS